MMIVVRETNEKSIALKIAKDLPRSFDQIGLDLMKSDLETHRLFGAYLENKMIGFVSYRELNPQAIEMSWLAVRPQYQGQGVGTSLVSESLRIVGEKYQACEVKTLSDIHPDPGYRKTREFYQKLGFIPLETIHPYPGWSKDSPCQLFVQFLGDQTEKAYMDQLCLAAKKLVIRHQRTSAIFLQKKLLIDFARASRLLDRLEADGVLGPEKETGEREILLRR